MSFCLFPLGLEQRILDIISIPQVLRGDLVCVDTIVVRRSEAKHPDQPHAHLLHDSARSQVVLIGSGNHTLYAQVAEAKVYERTRAFGGITFAPDNFALPIAESDLTGIGLKIYGIKDTGTPVVMADVFDTDTAERAL